MRFVFLLLILFAFCIVAQPVAASQSAAPLPITIEADSATVSESLGRSEYLGNVVIQQGSLRISADRVVLASSEGDLESITASVNPGAEPAQFEQAQSDNSPAIRASANSITYQVGIETLVLMGNARLMQGADRYEGNRLSYDLRGGLFKVESDGSEQDRINLIINPRPKP